jgi:hypothetical protein
MLALPFVYGPQVEPEALARYRAYQADMARYNAALAAQHEARDKALWDWLGDRPAAVASETNSQGNLWTLTVTIIGKTEEAVRAEIAAYERRYEPHVYLTRFQPIQPWQQGFKAVGERQESI